MNPAVLGHIRTALICLAIISEVLLPNGIMVILLVTIALTGRWLVNMQTKMGEQRALRCGIDRTIALISRYYSPQPAEGDPQTLDLPTTDEQ